MRKMYRSRSQQFTSQQTGKTGIVPGNMRILLLMFAMLISMILISGCEDDAATGPNTPGINPTAWVVNSIGETLAKVDLVSGQVVTNVIALNSAPNDIVISENLAYVVNSLSNNVQVIDLNGQETIGTIEILQGIDPYYICLDGQERAFVSNLLTGNVSVLDLVSGTEAGIISTGGIPEGVCVSGDYLYVTDVVDFLGDWQPGKVYAYDLETLTLQGTATVGINPQIVKMGPDGKLHVVCTGDYGATVGQVDIVDPVTMTVEQSLTLGGTPGSLVFTSAGIAYVGGGGWAGDGS
ncbi:hypothetical protein KKA00_07155, partial [bacterium]|nr:hypothetical protein [bacterium]